MLHTQVEPQAELTDGARDRQRIEPLQIREALAINNLGQILVTGNNHRNQNEAFVVTPVDGPQPLSFPTPEPVTAAVLAGFGIVLAWRRVHPATAVTRRPC